MNKKILSWNVNGVRAAQKKGLLGWLAGESPDILAIQETKALPEQLGPELLKPGGYFSYWHSAQKKGYSGVAIFTKERPVEIRSGLGIKQFDDEGRVQIAEYKDFYLMNIYFPNGKKDAQRLEYKLSFYQEFIRSAKKLIEKRKMVLVCGDVNTAHYPVDLARPKENEKVSGFLPEERSWLDRFEEQGLVDTFRHFNKEPGNYTWWDLKSRARERNVGWRIDYFYIDKNHLQNLKKAYIMPEVYGSDHCPIGIEIRC
jgi:exodeoxyribonuclease III